MSKPSIPSEIGSSKLGFFSKPELLKNGEHAGKVLKSYAFIKNKDVCEQVLANHDEYVLMLREAGIKVPHTTAELVQHKKRYSVRIYQEAFSAESMARKMMETSALEDCLHVMEGVLQGAISMLNYLQHHPDIRLGFHPTLRNYAVENGEFWYFDSFPPMAHMTQDELEWIILEFSPYSLPKWIKKLAKPLMHKVTNEYYQAEKMFLGIVGSSCRLRPEFTSSFLERATAIAPHLEDTVARKNIIQALETPPKLPLIWVLTRKILGKEGKGNISA